MEKNYYSNPISAFQKAIADAEAKPEHFDISAFFDKTRDYVTHVVESRRSGETSDAYRVRVFAELLVVSKRNDAQRSADNDEHRNLVLYAREAAESGHPERARRYYLRLIVATGSIDPVYWTLYGAFCAREGDLDAAMVCARRAVALDGSNRMGLFAMAALLMTANTDGYAELETLLDSLVTVHPRFGQGHFLAGVHFQRMDMRGRADVSFSMAGRFAGADNGDDDNNPTVSALRVGLDAVWEPVTGHAIDPAVECAVLLCRLELVELAATCLRTFAMAPHADPYHFTMAITHYRRGQYAAAADHLDSMARHRKSADGGWTLLAAHVDHEAGHYRESVVRYVSLSLQPHRAQYGLAYSRMAGHFAATGRYAEAADAYHRACTAIPAPALMIKLAACLTALGRYVEAERLLVDVVAVDGVYDGDAWHWLATVYASIGRAELANVCRRRAVELGYERRPFGRPFYHAKC